MFGFFKKKYNKKLNREHVELINQCVMFFTYADSLLDAIKEKDKAKGLLIDMSLDHSKNELFIIQQKKEYSKPLSNDDGAKLLEINKDCRRLFDNHIPKTQSFDEQFTSVGYKLGLDKDD